MLTVDDLTVHYRTLRGPVQALDAASFALDDGEIVGLAGESGCGKTTLGTSLIRLVAPMTFVRGVVVLDGVELPIGDDQRMRRYRFGEVSLIPQYAMSAMNPTRRIGRMVADLLRTHGVTFRDVERELRSRLELVGLTPDVLDMYPIELSGGMRQRMVMVLATLLNPSLLIADEITSALDVSSQRAVAELLVEFRDRGWVRSAIFITHDVAVLAQIADSIMVMYAGRIAEKAPTSDLIHRPKHPYSRMLIEALPEMGVRHRDQRLEGIPGTPPGLLDPPAGCRFADRCPLAVERCAEQPGLRTVGPGHVAACWRWEEV